RWAIRRALAQAPEARIVGEGQDARQLMAVIRRARAQALIVDAKILSGAPALINAIAQERMPVVLLGDSSDPEERAPIGQLLAAAGVARVRPRRPLPSSANFAPAAARLISALRAALDERALASNIAAARTQPGQREAPDRGPVRIVALASSTGGPQALQELLA